MGTEQRPAQSRPSFEDHRQIAMAGKSFTGPAIITLVLYFIFWIPGLIANVLYYKEAKEVQRVTGHSPQGMGCLSAMFWFAVISFVGIIILFISLVSH